MTFTSQSTQTSRRQHVSPAYTRTLFSETLSSVYKSEVSLYGDLVNVVNAVNTEILDKNIDLKNELQQRNDLNRLDLERHGAIRLGSPRELHIMSRFLGTMDIVSVGYYDLLQAGLPIHATCFRTTDLTELAENPLRLFVSLLRPEQIDSSLRPLVEEVLSKRQIFDPRVEELIEVNERYGGLTQDEAIELVNKGAQTFRWRSQATVSESIYKALLKENPILADIVAFRGPHINHLTPRVLDIDLVQSRMQDAGLPAKESIEGPPRRKNPILLRQTSYYAQREAIAFATKDGKVGFHTARFGEIEERGAALTPKGRALYDRLLESTLALGISAMDGQAYTQHFADFPDDWHTLRTQGLVWVRYSLTNLAKPFNSTTSRPSNTLESLIKEGVVHCEPIVYEDFLPISAAGIFQSNLKDAGRDDCVRPTKLTEKAGESLLDFERALGGKVLDEMELYQSVQEESLALVLKELGRMNMSRL